MKITKYQLRKIIKESLGLKEGLVKKAISKIPYKTINKVYDRHQGVGTFLANIKVNEKIKNARPEDWWEASTIGSSQIDSTKDGDSEDTSGVTGLSKRKDGYGYMMHRSTDGEYTDEKTGKKVIFNYDWACNKLSPDDRNYTWVRHQTFTISDDSGKGRKITMNKTNSDDAASQESYIVNGKKMSSLRDVYENLKATGVDIGMLFASIADGLETKKYEID